MDEDQIEQCARIAGKTPREYCLEKISTWKEHLRTVSDDCRGLDDEEFDELVEKEIDGWRRANDE